ncbi:uncharacterized protein LOC126678468 [Mercurialis annua]|uniref:uncharacterized protein LOC126678468 n=1 Tax=Mercurialis annua TaxID=3986 RepID=UPI00215EFA29|nr:uncharacterized protein LOC126678468 [Mercurialis annua]
MIALVAASEEAGWQRSLLANIPLCERPIPVVLIHCDSTATIAKIENRYYNDRRVDLGFAMEEGLVEACAQLRLTEEEQFAVNLEDVVDEGVEEKSDLSVVGRLLTNKPYSLNHMKNALASAWRLAKGFNMRDVGDNLFICEFFSKVDRAKILREGPWHFDKQLILLEPVKGNMQPNNLLLTGCPIWVRIYDLPLNCRGKAAVEKIGSKIGKVEERDDDSGGDWNRYSRIRVVIDTNKPLMRGMTAINPLGEKVWISFKYERVHNYCYWCGMLDHVEAECEDKPEQTDFSEWPYGPILRATPRRRKLMGSRMYMGSGSRSWENQSKSTSSNVNLRNVVRRNLFGENDGQDEVDEINDSDVQKLHETVAVQESHAGVVIAEDTIEGLVEVNVSMGQIDELVKQTNGEVHIKKLAKGSSSKKKKWIRNTPKSKREMGNGRGTSLVISSKRNRSMIQENVELNNLFSKRVRDGLSDKFGNIEISAETAEQSRRTQ